MLSRHEIVPPNPQRRRRLKRRDEYDKSSFTALEVPQMSRNRAQQTAEHTSSPDANKRQQDLTPSALTVPLILQRANADPASLTAQDMKYLQRTIGNRATIGILSNRTGLQAKLKLGPAGDKYEQEADLVAEQVVRQIDRPQPVQRENIQEEDELAQAKPLAPSISSLQRTLTHSKPNAGLQRQEWDEEELQAKPLSQDSNPVPQSPRSHLPKGLVLRRQEDEDELQMKPQHGPEGGEVDQRVEQQIQTARGGGKPLDDSLRSSMEQGFGADFSGVRVHTGSQAEALNRSLNAKAFTMGNDVFFGKGQYNPGSSSGRQLLAHELTHTVQQGATKVQRHADEEEIQAKSKAVIQRHAHSSGCSCSNCSQLQRKLEEEHQGDTLETISPLETLSPNVQREPDHHPAACACSACAGSPSFAPQIQRHIDEESIQAKSVPSSVDSQQTHGPGCSCGSCASIQRSPVLSDSHHDLFPQRVQRTQKAVTFTVSPVAQHAVTADVIQRHSSWEHKSLGDANPDDLSKIGAWQDLIEQTKAKGLRRRRDTDEAVVNIPIGADGAMMPVKKGNVLHILAQHLKLLDDWQTAPPTEGTAGAIHPTYQTVLVSIPGGGKDGRTPLVVTYGELNTLADYYGNIETMNAADPAIRWRIVQSVRKETFLRLKEIYDKVVDSLTSTEKRQREVQESRTMMQDNKLYNQKRDKYAPVSNQFMFADSIQQDYISSEIGQVNLLKKSGTGTDKADTNNYSATLGRNACHFVPESWHAWSSYHQKARLLAKRAWDLRQEATQQVQGLDQESLNRQNQALLKKADDLANEAMLNNGFGDHYLQDSYAGGHMINKTLIMKWFVEWLDNHATKMDFASDENWRKIQAIAYRQPEFAAAINGGHGQYNKSEVQGYSAMKTQNKAQNPQAVEDIGGDDWLVRFRALGLQVPASLRDPDSDTRKIVEWWQGGAAAGRFQSKTVVSGKRLLNSGLGLDFGQLKTALNALLADGIIHPDSLTEKRSTQKMHGFLTDKRSINPDIPLSAFEDLKFVLRQDYVPKASKMAEFRQARLQSQGGDDTAYQRMAAMVTYNDFFNFMNNGYLQKSTNALHNTFCTNGLTVTSGDGSLANSKVYGDDNMFNKGSSAGVKHSAETAHMSRDAIRNIIGTGNDGGETTAKILNRLPDQVTVDLTDAEGKVVGTETMDIATWHNSARGGTLKSYCFSKVFPSMGTKDKAVGAMGDLTKHLSKDQVHAGAAF
jgi:hypothetical protein